jgi:hypothetical protein
MSKRAECPQPHRSPTNALLFPITRRAVRRVPGGRQLSGHADDVSYEGWGMGAWEKIADGRRSEPEEGLPRHKEEIKFQNESAEIRAPT